MPRLSEPLDMRSGLLFLFNLVLEWVAKYIAYIVLADEVVLISENEWGGGDIALFSALGNAIVQVGLGISTPYR